jgi:hypothetical protein
MFVATIHDSIVTNSRENAAIVLETMRDEFVERSFRTSED